MKTQAEHQQAIEAACAAAVLDGYIVTVDQQALTPLAQGNYYHRVQLRPQGRGYCPASEQELQLALNAIKAEQQANQAQQPNSLDWQHNYQ